MSLLDATEADDGAVSVDGGASERRRRRIVQLVIASFVLLVIEGSIRKWLFPQYSEYIYFIRDPVVLIIYALALRNGAFKPLHPALAIGLLFAIVAIPLVAIQSLASRDSHLTLFAVYGWRNYFLYLPLPFVIATQFRERDLRNVCRVAFVALILSAPLAVAQFDSSPDAKVNVGGSEDEALQFTNLRSANGHIRPAGPFTSILGLEELTASTTAFALMCWILPRRERPVSWWFMILAAMAIAASLAVSGSRTMFLHVALVIASGMLSGFLMRRPDRIARATTIPLALVAVFVVSFPVVFPEGYATMMARWDEAYEGEQSSGINGVEGRFVAELLDFRRVVDEVPLAGFGLGLGGNAALTLNAATVDHRPIPYVETDWSRHMVDLGSVAGLLFILYRIAFTAWLGYAAARATARTRHPLPILLFGYVGIVLLEEQISGNGVVNGFAWLYVGFCMASCRAIASPDVVDAPVALPKLESVRPRNLMT